MSSRHHGHPVIADSPGHDQPIARAEARVGHDPLRHGDARRVENDPVQFSLAHHLGIARDNDSTGLLARLTNRTLNLDEIGPGKAFFDDDRAGQRHDVGRAHHREIIDRAGHR